MFFIPANNPTPSPIVPKVPSEDVSLVTHWTNAFSIFTPAFKSFDFTTLFTNSVHELERALSLPYFVQQRSLIFASYSL